MEFVPLRSLQRGLPEVWRTLRQENGRVILTNKGQPAYLLVDLAGENVISLINMLDEYKNARAKAAVLDEEKIPPSHSQTVDTVENFLAGVAELDDDALTDDEWAELENIRSQTKLSREIDL